MSAVGTPRDQQRVARAQTIENVIAIFSLQPPGHPAHNVTALPDGFYVPVVVFPDKQINVYALPWSRGWSIFVDDGEPTETGAYSWRDVKATYKSLQRPLYLPRDCVGAQHVPAVRIVSAVLNLVEYLLKLDHVRRARFRKKYWYWPRAAERSVVHAVPL